MFEYEETAKSEFPKLPTFMQWCKSATVQEARPLRYVKKVWVPGKFDNFTVETEVFRLRISPSSELYSALKDHLQEFESTDAALAIEVLDTANYRFKLKHIESERAIWVGLGQNGYALTIQSKPKSQRAAKKPVGGGENGAAP